MKKTLLILWTALAFVSLTACGQTANHKSMNETKNKKDMATIHLTTQEFKDQVWNYETFPQTFTYNGSLPAIVDFYATWCGPCKALSPVLESLAEEYKDKVVIYKVDVDRNRELSQVFGIRSIPTLLFIPADGSQPSLSAGAPSKSQLKELIEKMTK